MNRRYCASCLTKTSGGVVCPEHRREHSRSGRRLVIPAVTTVALIGGTVFFAWDRWRDGTKRRGITEASAQTVPTPSTSTTIPPPLIVVFTKTVNGNTDIWARDNRTDVETNLADDPAEDSHPSLNYRAGSRIVFQSNRTENFEIFVMENDGSRERRVTTNDTDDTQPDWAPDERRIVFVATRDGNREIYVMDSDGSHPRRLTVDSADDYEPAWASNVRLRGGNDIAFVSQRHDNEDIYVMKPDGSDLRRLTDDEDWDCGPAWSPDGTRIAFVSHRDGNNEIYVMNADGSGQTRLTDSPSDDESPAWSPDGKQIRFWSDRSGEDRQYSMNPDGTGQVMTARP